MDAARTLVSRLHPDLSREAVRRIAARAGGNPLLLEELAASGEPSESLRLALAARLRLLRPRAREAFSLLALAGRPLARDVLDEDGEELVEAGLCTIEDGSFAVRHALLGETAASEPRRRDGGCTRGLPACSMTRARPPATTRPQASGASLARRR
jgi:hypothetical protein